MNGAKLHLSSESRYPKWLIKSFEDIIDSREWNGFLGELQDTIQQQLTESRVQQFADLSDAEKLLFLDKGVKALHGSPSHQVISTRISQTIDKQANDHINRELTRETPYQTRTDSLIGSMQDAVVTILQRWPELRSKMTRYLNQPIPESMRHHVWKVFLTNDLVHQQYQKILQTNPRIAISPHDKALTQRVEQMIVEEPTFHDVRGSVGAFYAIKAVLSYYHAMKQTEQPLTDTEMLLAVPFVKVIHHRISKREPPHVKAMEVIVQEYFTFMKGRPSYMVDNGSEQHEQDIHRFSQKVMSFVSKMDPGLLQIFMDAFAPSSVEIIATEMKMFELLGDAMVSLIRPIIKPFFVGILASETLLFLWDQYLIGMDSPGFQDLFLPIATACLLVLLRNDLRRSTNIPTYETVLKKEGPRLRVCDFQYLINQHFYSDLFRVVSMEKGGPILDPTQRPLDPGLSIGPHPQWKEWFSDLGVPKRTEPRERQEYRIFKESERQRVLDLERQKKEEEARRVALEDRLRSNEMQRRTEMMAEKEKNEKERQKMEDELAKERQRRVDQELRSQAEIKRLEHELEKLRLMGMRTPEPIRDAPPRFSRPPTRGTVSPGGYSLYILPPPAPSPASHMSPLPAVQEVNELQQLSSDQKAREAFIDYFKKCSEAVHTVNDGEGDQREYLNNETKRFIVEHSRDMRECEIELFGHPLADGELQQMDEGNNRYYSNKLMEAIVDRTNNRRKNELEEGRKFA